MSGKARGFIENFKYTVKVVLVNKERINKKFSQQEEAEEYARRVLENEIVKRVASDNRALQRISGVIVNYPFGTGSRPHPQIKQEETNMTAHEYIKSKGLVPAHVAQKMGVKRQCVEQYGKTRNPTAHTLEKLAAAMTSLGVETTVIDLVKAIYPQQNGGNYD